VFFYDGLYDGRSFGRYVYVRECVIDGYTGRCGVVGSTLAYGSIVHGFESEHRLFSHHGASDFIKLRSLTKCSLDDSVHRLP